MKSIFTSTVLMLGLILLAMAYGAALGHIVEVMVTR
jgi:VIT1/CCC1 family predicted Fe2+/Mn2+ transporter